SATNSTLAQAMDMTRRCMVLFGGEWTLPRGTLTVRRALAAPKKSTVPLRASPRKRRRCGWKDQAPCAPRARRAPLAQRAPNGTGEALPLRQRLLVNAVRLIDFRPHRADAEVDRRVVFAGPRKLGPLVPFAETALRDFDVHRGREKTVASDVATDLVAHAE